MTDDDKLQAEDEILQPDPALKALDVLIGTWDLKGRTLDSDKDNITGGIRLNGCPVDSF